MVVGVEDFSPDEAGLDVGEVNRQTFHSGKLSKGGDVGRLHFLGGRIGWGDAERAGSGDRSDDRDMGSAVLAIFRGVSQPIHEVGDHADHAFAICSDHGKFLFEIQLRILVAYSRDVEEQVGHPDFFNQAVKYDCCVFGSDVHPAY